MQHAFQSYLNALISASEWEGDVNYRRQKPQEKLNWTIIQTLLLALPSYFTTSKHKYTPRDRLAIIPITSEICIRVTYHLKSFCKLKTFDAFYLYTLISSTPLLSELYRGLLWYLLTTPTGPNLVLCTTWHTWNYPLLEHKEHQV
jgi:hypothetical protein